MPDKRVNKIQIMLGDDELGALEDWRFAHKMPSRAAAIRGLLRFGLKLDIKPEDLNIDPARVGSRNIGVIGDIGTEPDWLAKADTAIPVDKSTAEIIRKLSDLRGISPEAVILEACEMALSAWEKAPSVRRGYFRVVSTEK